MKLVRIASFVHKWLALLVGIQIVFWVVSGVFFTMLPIEQIRSEHLIRERSLQAPNLAALGDLSTIRDGRGRTPTRIIAERRPGGDVVLAEFADASPILFDAATLRPLTPLDEATAMAIARSHVTLEEAPRGAVLVNSESPEYRGTLPAWRVDFAEGGLSVYVAANTGAVTARRSDLWRLYDALWALHIMDWQDHENFNHPLIVVVTWLTLLSVIAGIALIPFRIRFGRRRTAV